MSKVNSRLIIINIFMLALLLAAWIYSQPQLVLLLLSHPLSWVICGLVIVGDICAFMGQWKAVKWIGEKLPAIGLMATVAGILVVSHGAGELGSLDTMRTAIIKGVGLALGPNLTGIAGYIILSTMSFLCRGEDY